MPERRNPNSAKRQKDLPPLFPLWKRHVFQRTEKAVANGAGIRYTINCKNRALSATGGDIMLKLEIKFDDTRMWEERKYAPEAIYAAVDKAFAKYHFPKETLSDGTVCYCGTGMARDYGTFGRIITTLKDKEWFMDYLVKWLWYNSDDGENETDFTVEDVLYHYTHRESAA